MSHEIMRCHKWNRVCCQELQNGLGGVGKTQMALEFARKHQETYSAIFWLNGTSKDTLLSSLSALGRQLAGKEKDVEDVEDLEKTAQVTLQWLGMNRNKDWLLIYDNVDREWPSKISNPEAYDIRSYFPSRDRGSIIVTTRLQNLADLGPAMRVGMVDFGQGLSILAKNTKMSESTEGKAVVH